jgi:glycerophosphoryl diester phosphodiesterase
MVQSAVAALASGCATLPASVPQRPIVIAHRGASGYRPEHTLSAYRLGIAQGADYIEPDLVFTKDGVLICRHENEIGGTTDVATRPEFADRRATKRIDGEDVTGWFTEDFTLAEIRTLRCRERLPEVRPSNTAFDGLDTIPTFEEVIALAVAEGARLGRVIGVYPETKHPTYFDGLGYSFDAPLLSALAAAGWDNADAPVFIQSFEVNNLERLSQRTRVRLVQLVSEEGGPADRTFDSYAAMLSDTGLSHIRSYADGLGPQKSLIVPRDSAGRSLGATDLVQRAHCAGLVVHPWTFRAENTFLPLELRSGVEPGTHGDLASEIHMFLALGVDGVFSDFPDLAVSAVDTWSFNR